MNEIRGSHPLFIENEVTPCERSQLLTCDFSTGSYWFKGHIVSLKDQRGMPGQVVGHLPSPREVTGSKPTFTISDEYILKHCTHPNESSNGPVRPMHCASSHAKHCVCLAQA